MINETLTIIAVVSASIGALASTFQGFKSAQGQSYSLKKLVSALISSVFFAVGIVNITGLSEQVNQVGYVGVVLMNLMVGYGIDQAHSALDRQK